MASAKGNSIGYRGKRVTKDRLASASSYEKAKNKTNASVLLSAIRKKRANDMGAEGPKKSSPRASAVGKSGGRGVAANKRPKKK